MSKEKYVCENCNKEFYEYKSHKRGKHIFCSMSCQHEWRTGKTGLLKKKGTYKECPICGNKFYCYPYEVDKRKTCSKECKYEYERLLGIHQGENCNFWTGGFDNYRGKNWYSQREKARKRDNNTCQVCGKTIDEHDTNMIVHHKVPFRFFQNDYKKANDLDNLVCVCRNCHAKQESHQWSEVPIEYQYLLKGLKPQLKPPAGKRYSKEEIDFIKENYDKMTYEELANIMNRPKNSVSDKILELGLNKRKNYTGLFSDEEKELVKKYYPIMDKNELMKLFPNRTYGSISSFARRNKIKKQR
jgi:5-methylcytosine-specific restriction endonuclease McrA